jgi:hypothetical protein
MMPESIAKEGEEGESEEERGEANHMGTVLHPK